MIEKRYVQMNLAEIQTLHESPILRNKCGELREIFSRAYEIHKCSLAPKSLATTATITSITTTKVNLAVVTEDLFHTKYCRGFITII